MKDTEIPRDRRWSTIFDPMYEMIDEVELSFGGLYFVAALLFYSSSERNVILFQKTPDADDLRDNYIPPLKIPEILIQYHDLKRHIHHKDLNTIFKEAAISLLLNWLDSSFRFSPEVFEKIKQIIVNQTPLIKFFIPRVEIVFVVEYTGLITFPVLVGSLRGNIYRVKWEEILSGEWKFEKPTEEFLKELFAKT